MICPGAIGIQLKATEVKEEVTARGIGECKVVAQ